MIEERTRLVGLLLCGYLISFALAVLCLNLMFGVNPGNREWVRWYWDVLTGGVQSPIERTILISTGLALLLASVLPALVPRFTPWRLDAYGGSKAAWARPADVWWLRWRYGVRITRRLRPGIVLGRYGRRGCWITLRSPLFVLCFGPAGEGKTAGVLIPSTLNLPNNSLVVNDPAGEIMDATKTHRQQLGRIVRLEWGSPNSQCFNPLMRANLPTDPVAICDYIDALASILIPPSKGNDSSSFFINASRSALSAAIGYQVFGCLSADEDTSIGEVLSWLSMLGADSDDEEDEDPVGTDLRRAVDTARNLAMPKRIVEALASFATARRGTRADILSTIRDDHLALWRNEYVCRATATSDLSLAELTNPDGPPVTIYLVVPVADQERYGKATGVFLEAVYSALTRLAYNAPRRPVTLILDELKFIPPLRLVKDGPSILRKFKVNGIYGFQDRGQVVDVYEQTTLDAFDTNVVAMTIFTLGHLDTAKWVSERVGTHWSTKRVQTGSSMNPAGGALAPTASESASREQIALVTATDAMSLAQGRHLIMFRSKPHRPVHAHTPFYFKHQPLTRRSRRGG